MFNIYDWLMTYPQDTKKRGDSSVARSTAEALRLPCQSERATYRPHADMYSIRHIIKDKGIRIYTPMGIYCCNAL